MQVSDGPRNVRARAAHKLYARNARATRAYNARDGPRNVRASAAHELYARNARVQRARNVPWEGLRLTTR